MQNIQILVIGGGRMGSAIIRGWLEEGLPANNIHVIDQNPEQIGTLQTELGIQGYTGLSDINMQLEFDAILVALKPQVIPAVLPDYQSRLNASGLLISIAAGITNDNLEKLLPGSHGTVRVMPNTPALIRKGVIVACPGNQVTTAQQALCKALFQPLGSFFWLEDEDQMHAVTAVSGSGPAYLFHFAECMVNAAQQSGLPAELGRKLAIQTVTGAAAMVAADTRELSQLRQEVTSPGGTTAAALEQFMNGQALEALVTRAISAAGERSRQLADS